MALIVIRCPNIVGTSRLASTLIRPASLGFPTFYDGPFVASGFLRDDAKNVFDSEYDLAGPARGKISRFCARNFLSEGKFAYLAIGELLMMNQEGQYAAFCSLPIGDVKLYGQKEMSFRVAGWGALDGVPFAKHEIGMFCLASALSDLLEELKISYPYSQGRGLRSYRDAETAWLLNAAGEWSSCGEHREARHVLVVR